MIRTRQAKSILKDLQTLLKAYEVMYFEKGGEMYKSKLLSKLMEKARTDIESFEILLYDIDNTTKQ